MRYFLFVLIFLTSSLASATTIQKLTFEQLSSGAELIFEGRVLASQTSWNGSKTEIATEVTFEVVEVLSGDLQTGQLVLRFLGGTVDGHTMRVQATRYPEVGEQGVYFVESITRKMVNPLLGWTQGHFKIKDGVVATVNDSIIVGIDDTGVGSTNLVSKGEISEGVVAGVKTKQAQSSEAGMSVDEFKQLILDTVN